MPEASPVRAAQRVPTQELPAQRAELSELPPAQRERSPAQREHSLELQAQRVRAQVQSRQREPPLRVGVCDRFCSSRTKNNPPPKGLPGVAEWDRRVGPPPVVMGCPQRLAEVPRLRVGVCDRFCSSGTNSVLPGRVLP